MPWRTVEDVVAHNKRAASDPHLRKQWTDVANKVLASTKDEGRAIREANAAVGRNRRGK